MENKIIIHGTEELAKFLSELLTLGRKFKATPLQNGYNVTSYSVEIA